MTERSAENGSEAALGRALLWDLAGTLLVYDRVSGHSRPLPGWEHALPDLARDFRMVVATGEESDSARRMLAKHEVLAYFEDVFGDLLAPGGKPHGEILRQMGARPELSLVIGDRLRGDIPADCDELVTLLINQEAEILDARQVAALVRTLQQTGPTMTAAFRELAARAQPDPAALGHCGGGLVSAAWRSDELSGARLWIFEPDWMDARRQVIVP